MEKILKLTPDYQNQIDSMSYKVICDKLSAKPKRTRIIISDSDTGEIHGEFHNKIILPGSIFAAMNLWGVPTPVILPDYNRELNLDNTLDYSSVMPKNTPVICLFCVGDSGCGPMPKDVIEANYLDRIDIDDIIPFRYVDKNNDLNDDLRKIYFGRKTLTDKIAYYFKAFDTTPQLHLRYSDGTQINDEIYNILTKQDVECYVETMMSINRLDMRDYIEQVKGWDNARVSSISLCYAWYDATINKYRWYQQIYPYTKLNFSVEWLVDLTKAITIQYQVFY